MPNATTSDLPAEYQERPKCFKITVSMPYELKGFIATQANQKRYRWARGANASAFIRDLVEAKRDELVGKRRK